MKKWTLVTLLTLLIACGSEAVQESPDVSTAPSDQCDQGGIALTVDGETYHICNGQDGLEGIDASDGVAPTIEVSHLAIGAEGNTCQGAAIQIEIEYPNGDVVTELVCQTFGPISTLFSEFIGAEIDLEEGSREATCGCRWEQEGFDSVEACIDAGVSSEPAITFLTWCVDEAYWIYDRSAPEEVENYLNCNIDKVEEFVQCGEFLDGGLACEPEDFQAFSSCQSNVDFQGCFAELQEEPEAAEWFGDFTNFLELFGCFQNDLEG